MPIKKFELLQKPSKQDSKSVFLLSFSEDTTVAEITATENVIKDSLIRAGYSKRFNEEMFYSGKKAVIIHSLPFTSKIIEIVFTEKFGKKVEKILIELAMNNL
jgi:hypothetical protein